MTGVVPRFTRTPGSIGRTGPSSASTPTRCSASWLGVDEEELASLVQAGAV